LPHPCLSWCVWGKAARAPLFHGELFERNLAVVKRLEGLAEQQGITVAQLAIAWVLANPAVDVAILGARHPHQIAQTVPAADIHLSQQTLREIEQMMREAVPVGGPSPEGMKVMPAREKALRFTLQ
jgi:aryl-alcohol dehydrogenase-like predicted oxidoreductase